MSNFRTRVLPLYVRHLLKWCFLWTVSISREEAFKGSYLTSVWILKLFDVHFWIFNGDVPHTVAVLAYLCLSIQYIPENGAWQVQSSYSSSITWLPQWFHQPISSIEVIKMSDQILWINEEQPSWTLPTTTWVSLNKIPCCGRSLLDVDWINADRTVSLTSGIIKIPAGKANRLTGKIWILLRLLIFSRGLTFIHALRPNWKGGSTINLLLFTRIKLKNDV